MTITYDKCKRIEAIIYDIFPSIIDDYREKRWTKDEALNRLDKYRNKGYYLAQDLETKDKCLALIDLEYDIRITQLS